jgi:hypothetical protein
VVTERPPAGFKNFVETSTHAERNDQARLSRKGRIMP